MTSPMFLGGLQKSSLIDYPGRVSCVCFVSGCNFHCPYCHNPELVRGDPSHLSPVDDQSFYAFLAKRKRFLDGVVISGGEPTLRKDLREICATIKTLGYPLKLDTNGSQPLMIKNLIQEGLVDYIAMDIKTDPLLYPSTIARDCDPDQILSSIRIIMSSAPCYEFRTTCVRPLVDEDVVEKISQLIHGARLYVLQGFHGTKVLNPEFFEGIEPGYTQEEMAALRSIAERWVTSCIIR
jgi:pyruvate formate lyase activating enzyme